ncbi:helix-turn-helix domain-containing protein [Rhizomonospora bruguierae]|uniref:helix-turn-helix domain-containing protein n=1 Tax=Rhizomonospora bruguierae TaxID=1581705 RepID=UPI001BCB3D13
MAQAPAELRPFESPRHYLGAELRAWRRLRGYSLARLGHTIHASGALLGKIEKAQRWPTKDLIARCDDALEAAGTLTRLYDLARDGFQEVASDGVTWGSSFPARVGATHPETETSAGSGLSLGVDGHAGEVVNLAAYRRRRMASSDSEPVVVV